MTMRRICPKRRDLGLSLLETLVAISLLALVGVFASGGLRFGSTVWERVEAEGVGQAEMQAVSRYLRSQIAAARPIRRVSGSVNPPIAFYGSTSSVTFLAPITAHIAQPGLHWVTLRGDPLDDGLTLAFAPGSNAPPANALSPRVSRKTDLLPVPAHVRFAFLDPGKNGRDPEWTEQWIDRDTLPAAVRLRLATGRADKVDGRVLWPDLIIPLDFAGSE